ncbi:MAG: ATP synthase F1 subunit epsilon, partial [Dehalococcoidia bacterium]|nr:ATP synthase F1 subunit epsilon [Dehalococcoidia bacterium]
MAKIKLEIVTAERRVYSEDVDGVIAPGIGGELGILPNHAPLMSILAPGVLTIKQDGVDVDMAIAGGYIEVRPDYIIVLADAA